MFYLYCMFQNRKQTRKHKDHRDFEKTVYYSDFVPFAHDPPGHTCGLPCCNSDLYIRLKVSGHHAGCMSMPFQQTKHEDAEENFTLRRNQLHLLKGRPTFKNGGFYSVQQHRNEQRKAVPSFASLPRDSTGQRHFLQGRGITLPRIDLSQSSSDATKATRIGRHDHMKSDDSDSSSESEYQHIQSIEKRRITQKRCESDMPQLPRIHPMELLKARRKFGIADDNEESTSSDDESNYYNEIVMSNFKLQESNLREKAKTCTSDDSSDDVFLPRREPTYHTLNLDKTFVYDSKRSTLERMTRPEKYPDLSRYEPMNLENTHAAEIYYNENDKDGINTAIRKITPDHETATKTSSDSAISQKPTHVPLKSALKTRSLQHDRKKKKISYDTPKSGSLDRHGRVLYGNENRGFVNDDSWIGRKKDHGDGFVGSTQPLDTIDESPITLIL